MTSVAIKLPATPVNGPTRICCRCYAADIGAPLHFSDLAARTEIYKVTFFPQSDWTALPDLIITFGKMCIFVLVPINRSGPLAPGLSTTMISGKQVLLKVDQMPKVYKLPNFLYPTSQQMLHKNPLDIHVCHTYGHP